MKNSTVLRLVFINLTENCFPIKINIFIFSCCQYLTIKCYQFFPKNPIPQNYKFDIKFNNDLILLETTIFAGGSEI